MKMLYVKPEIQILKYQITTEVNSVEFMLSGQTGNLRGGNYATVSDIGKFKLNT